MKKILAPIIFLVFSSFNATVIESDSANYDGKTMYLKGSVLLKHEKGTITADNATIVKEDQKKGFSSIHVEDHVVFNPSFGGELTADLLDMKAEEKIAYLKALNPSSWVTYRGDFSGQPLIFKSSSLLFDFSDDNKQKVFSGIKK